MIVSNGILMLQLDLWSDVDNTYVIWREYYAIGDLIEEAISMTISIRDSAHGPDGNDLKA